MAGALPEFSLKDLINNFIQILLPNTPNRFWELEYFKNSLIFRLRVGVSFSKAFFNVWPGLRGFRARIGLQKDDPGLFLFYWEENKINKRKQLSPATTHND